MRQRPLGTVNLLIALSLVAACGGAPPEDAASKALESRSFDPAALLSLNGLSTNGLSTNGMSTNGLSTNGLSTNGLSTVEFANWYLADVGFSNMVLSYLARCALPAGVSHSLTYGGATYTFTGAFGLAPVWASGLAAPVEEQQLVSACFAAHANKYGAHVDISVRGYYANGAEIAIDPTEQATFTVGEGCFFGNLFNGAGVFSGYSKTSPMFAANKTSKRACAQDKGKPGSCAPMVATAHSCQYLCTGVAADITDHFEYKSCTWNGVAYKPVTTLLKPADITTCNGNCP